MVDEESEEQKILLASYSSNHAESCIPNSTQHQFKAVRVAIKDQIIDNPTMKPSLVYAACVDRVRDNLGEGFKEDFDQLMPTQVFMPGNAHQLHSQVQKFLEAIAFLE